MKINFNDYENLLSNLIEIQSVTDDSSNNENLQSIIFKITKTEDGGKLELAGLNNLITFKKTYPAGKFTLVFEDNDNAPFSKDGVLLIQIKSKELINFLNSYKNLSSTYVEGLSFNAIYNEKGVGNVTCVVFEAEISEGDNPEKMASTEIEGFLNMVDDTVAEGSDEYTDDEYSDEDDAAVTPSSPVQSSVDPSKHWRSQWVFDLLPILKQSLLVLGLKAPEDDLEHINMGAFVGISKNLLPIIENGTDIYSYFNFSASEENIASMVVTFNSAFTSFISNPLNGNTFEGIRLHSKVVNFIDKIIVSNVKTAEDTFDAKLLDNYLYINWGNNHENEVFIIYDKKLSDYKKILSNRTKDSYLTIDKFYFKDVIKRLSLINDSIEVTIDSDLGLLHLSNSKFKQEISILDQDNLEMYNGSKFRIMPDILNKAIIDSSRESSSRIKFYFGQNGIMTIMDDDNKWQSLVRVRVK